MYKYENYQSKKVKKTQKPVDSNHQSSHLGVFFLLACISSSTVLYIIYYLTFQQFFLISRSKRDKVFGINVIQCTCIQVWELSPLLHHYIFNRTLTKASNCCSTTSQTILDLSPLVGEPPFTTFYREKNIQISFRHDIMHVQIILECGMGWSNCQYGYLQFEICLLILCNHLTQENSFDIFLQFSINP